MSKEPTQPARPKTLNRPAYVLSDAELCAEDAWLVAQWEAMRAALEESGGMSGSPGEWLAERIDEVCSVMRSRGLPEMVS